MRKSQPFRGTGVALVSPFKNHEIDFDALAKVIDYVIDGGVEFVVSLGTTGETPTLSAAEQIQVLEYTVKKTDGRVKVVAGVGGNNTGALVQQLKGYHFDGVDAILSSSPYYNKPSQEGIFQHYMALADASPKPIILYNVPGRTSSNIAAETTLRLAEASEQFIAIKDASPNLNQLNQVVKHRPEDFLVLSGDDELTLALLACGGDGVISVIANATPRVFSDMVREALAGNIQAAAQLNMQLLDIHHWLYSDGNPAGIKAAMEILGLCSKEVRLPLVAMEEANYSKLKAELAKSLSLTF